MRERSFSFPHHPVLWLELLLEHYLKASIISYVVPQSHVLFKRMSCSCAFRSVQHIFCSRAALSIHWGLKTSSFPPFMTPRLRLRFYPQSFHFSRRRQVGIAFRTGSSENFCYTAETIKRRDIGTSWMARPAEQTSENKEWAPAVQLLPLGGIVRKWRGIWCRVF